MVFIDRVPLIDVELEEFVVNLAPVIFVPVLELSGSENNMPVYIYLRVKLLKIGLDQLVFAHLIEAISRALLWDKVSLRFEWPEVDLLDQLYGKGCLEVTYIGNIVDSRLSRKCSPC